MHLFIRRLMKKNSTVRFFSTEINKTNEKWDLLAGVSLERLPILTKEFNKSEKNISHILAQIELENSHKSLFEIRLESDEKRRQQIKEGKIGVDDIDNAPQQTGQDLLDVYHAELESFKFGSRIVEENIEKNVKSSRRSLGNRLLLLTKEKIGNQELWILPQGIYKGENSLRMTAERILQEKCGDSINARFLGNCPCGFYKYKYPTDKNNASYGAKIFFFKAQLIKGDVDEKICKHFHWARRDELSIMPTKYCKSIKKFLVDEECN